MRAHQLGGVLATQPSTDHLVGVAITGKSRRWTIVGLIAVGVVLAALLPRPWADETMEDSDSDTAKPSANPQYASSGSSAAGYPLDGGVASRRIAEDCDPVAEALRYEEFIGHRAHAILSWSGMPQQAAGLEIPVFVVGVEDGAVGVRLLQVPGPFAAMWLRSGHIRAAPEGVFLLDPCSATIAALPTDDETTAGDAFDEDDESWLDDDDDLEDEDVDVDERRPTAPPQMNITIPTAEELEGLKALEGPADPIEPP